MIRSIGLAATLSMVAALVMSLSVSAQEKKPAGASAPARAAAPAPRAAPAPAPRVSAPTFHAPAPHFSAPVQHSAPIVRSAPIHRPAPVVRAPTHVAPTVRMAPSHVTPKLSTTTRSTVSGTNVQLQKSTATQLRLQHRQERVLRRAETHQLRSLPPSQRAARRLEIQNARQLRAQQKLQIQSGAATQIKSGTITQTQVPELRRSGMDRVTTQAAIKGRFSAPFAATGTHAGYRHGAHIAAHRAWRRGLRAGFVPWYGPVFWPYAYSDVFDYAFWPYGYDDGYWAYAYDNFFDGVFWGEYGPPEDYAYAAPSAPRASYAGVRELCKQPGSGITAWPFAEIERKVGLTDEQKQLLGDVRKAGSDAAASFKASCPANNVFPLTPPGRLAAMTARLDATLQAVQTVRPALEKFYASLSDEQKERFNTIGPKKPTSAEANQAAADPQSCKEQKPGLTNLPIERIEDAVKPTDAQATELKSLEDATAKAVSILQAACPEDTPLTPPGRLEAMESRLKAMIEAANTVKPALESFYRSLSPEQKARFNRIGGALARAD